MFFPGGILTGAAAGMGWVFRLSVGWQIVILVVGWGFLYLPGLGTRELQGEEARRVLPGRTMLQTGDWVVPRSAGEIYNRKPPLINWATAAAIRVTGRMDEWTVRLPSVLAMLMLALGVLGATRRWLGSAGAFLAACMCLSNLGFVEKGRLAEIEALYIGSFGIAMALWLGGWWRDRRWWAWSLSMLVMGIGFLAKGPVHLWYFYAVVVGVLWAEGRLWELCKMPHLVGVLLFVLPWAPWAWMNAARNPKGDSGGVWADQVTHRLGLVEFDVVNWGLQIPQSLVNLLPWALLLPLLWLPGITRQWAGLGKRGVWLRGLRAGLLVGFLVIALLPSSRPRFMLPIQVVAIFVMVECLALWTAERRSVWLGRWLRGVQAVSVVVLLVGVGAQLVGPEAAATAVGGMVVGSALVVLSFGWVGGVRRRLASAETEPWMNVLGVSHLAVMGSGVLLLSATVLPMTTMRDDLRPFAREIRDHIGETDSLVLYKLDERMWPFYLGLRCREIASLEELPAQADWVMVEADKIENRRREMERRFGVVRREIAIQEPMTDNAGGKGVAYVLLGFGLPGVGD